MYEYSLKRGGGVKLDWPVVKRNGINVNDMTQEQLRDYIESLERRNLPGAANALKPLLFEETPGK